MQGVYEIVCLSTGRRYVGSAVDIDGRKRLHWSQLRRGVHHSRFMQRAWNKYGELKFVFRLLEEVVSEKELLFTEQRYINLLKPDFNSCPIAGNSFGFKHSALSREKMSLMRRGMPSPRKGQSHTKEVRERMSKAKIGNSFFAGRVHSAKSRSAMAIAKTGARNARAIPVAQYSKAGKLIATYSCLAAASRCTAVDAGNIRHVLAGRSRRAGSFYWKQLN